MDDEFAELESELLRLRPRHPGSRLETRLADELELPSAAEACGVRLNSRPPSTSRQPLGGAYVTTTSWTSWKWANWAVATVLVAGMISVSVHQPSPSRGSRSERLAVADGAGADASLRPVKAVRTLIGCQVDGVVELADGSAVQRVRDFYVDTIEWRDPQGGAQLRWELPRESVRFVGLPAY